MDTPEDGAGSAGASPAEPRPAEAGTIEAGTIEAGTIEAGTIEAGTTGTGTAGARARIARGRRPFRAWRRSRPFWGGLLLLLAGVELLAIPLLSVLAHGSVKVVIYIGIGGIFGVLIGGLLVACGLLIWYHPVQRVFYAIAGVLLAVASFVATNLGGFFLGMLLGVTGASLSFGWTPGPGRLAGQRRPRRAGSPSEGLGLVLAPEPARESSPGRADAGRADAARADAERAVRVVREGAGASGADHEARWMP